MAETKALKQRAPRRHLPPAEKRRIVELALRADASVGAIAREHGVNPNNVYHWKSLYRAGTLTAQEASAPGIAGAAASAFFPVRVVPKVRRPQPTMRPDVAVCSGIVQLVLASGATLRIETSALDASLLCALIAELQR